MKQEVQISQQVKRFLRLSAQSQSSLKKDKTSPQAEVVAIGAVKSEHGADKKKKKAPDFILHADFSDYNDTVAALVESEDASPKSAHGCFIRNGGVRGATHLLVQGLGRDRDGVNHLGGVERLRRLGATVAHKLLAEKVKSAAVYLDSFLLEEADLIIDPSSATYAFAEGFGLSLYKFHNYKTGPQSKKDEAVTLQLIGNTENRIEAYEEGIAQAEALLNGTYLARDLGNEPSNELFPAEFGARARKLASALGLKCTVLDEKAIMREKMGLLIGVGQGSLRPPRLILLDYTPKGVKKGSKLKTIAFVGKGITFDSGGISIKPSSRMEDMKHDMCGAAAVVGAISAVAQLKLPVRVITIVAAAENMPSGNAVCPGHILESRAGKTVEISNTDAEGRLVLADALDYVQDMKPDYIIDLATLTGAITVTLGKSCAGLMGNNEDFNKMVGDAAKTSGERIWELPLFDEYFDDLKSEYADMRNSGDTPSHGAAKGAMFLQEFIRKGTKWVHLDIAAVAYGVGFVPYYPKKSSTGYGVRLLVELARQLT